MNSILSSQISDFDFVNTGVQYPESSFNKITIMLLIFLIIACCLLCIGYDFNFSNMFSSGIGLCACFILSCFLIYILWNHFYGAGSGNTEQMISQETKDKYMGKYKDFSKVLGQTTYNMGQRVQNPTLNNWSNRINDFGYRVFPQNNQSGLPVQTGLPAQSGLPVQVARPI
jgi:hypothetical protein